MKVVEKNVIGFYAFLEKHKSKIKRTLKTREQIEKELDKEEKEKIKKGIENINQNIAHETNKLCN